LDFKQKPGGPRNRSVVEDAIQPFAARLKLLIGFNQEHQTLSFGDYVFSAEVFREMIRYVEAGGMPGWLDGKAPDDVARMMTQLSITYHWFFRESTRR